MFKFGDSKPIKSNKTVTLPVQIGDIKAKITTDVIDYDIPLLLSKEAMKKASTKIDFSNDEINIFDQRIKPHITSSGHYCLKLKNDHDNPSQQYASISLICKDIKNIPANEKPKVALKLHRQFAHPPAERLIQLILDSGIADADLSNHVHEISKNCQTCEKYKKAKPRPVVGFPIAKVFNETLAMDLKEVAYSPKIWLLHVIDHATRYSASCVIRSKKKEVIVKKLFQIWISTFGHPKKIFVDNGREFENSEFMSFCENMNIRILTTAAESPWSNGLVERHNAVLGLAVSKIVDDKKCDLELATTWAISAKNALKNVNGYSFIIFFYIGKS